MISEDCTEIRPGVYVPTKMVTELGKDHRYFDLLNKFIACSVTEEEWVEINQIADKFGLGTER